MKKLYIGYCRVDESLEFKLSETPVWENDRLGYDTRNYLYVAPDNSVQYLQKCHLDSPIKLKFGEVIYSFDKEKVSKWLFGKYTATLEEITERYNNITNTDIQDYSSDLELTDKRCPKCSNFLHRSDVEGYPYVCLECDENFYEIEVM